MSDRLQERLEWMKERGSSVDLNWGEDTGQWECSWITDGKRFTGISRDPHEAAVQAVRKARRGEEDDL